MDKFVETIKTIALGAIESTHPVEVVYGKTAGELIPVFESFKVGLSDYVNVKTGVRFDKVVLDSGYIITTKDLLEKPAPYNFNVPFNDGVLPESIKIVLLKYNGGQKFLPLGVVS